MNKQYKIKELTEQREKLREEIDALNKEIHRLEREEKNIPDYEGKFIYIKDYGYMFVTWQKYDSDNYLYNDDCVFFQGVYFDTEWSPYRDSAWAEFNVMKEWFISYNDFITYLNHDGIRELSQEEFFEKAELAVKETKENFIDWLNYTFNDYNKKKNEQSL